MFPNLAPKITIKNSMIEIFNSPDINYVNNYTHRIICFFIRMPDVPPVGRPFPDITCHVM